MLPKGASVVTIAVLLSGAAAAQDYRQTTEANLHPYPFDGSVIEEVRYRNLLKVGIGLFEPWVMCGADGGLIGYEIDVGRKLADDIGVRIQFVRTDWYFIIPALIEREFDLIISGMAITPQRSLHVNFSAPYSEFGTVIVANSMRTAGLTTLEDFDSAGVVFGVRAGTVPEQAAVGNFPTTTVRTFDSDSELLEALTSGAVQVAAVDQVKGSRWLDANPETLRRPFDELFNKVPEAIALRKGDVDGLNFLDSWIAHHRTTGWLDERRHYWFETTDWSELTATDQNAIARCDESFAPNPY